MRNWIRWSCSWCARVTGKTREHDLHVFFRCSFGSILFCLCCAVCAACVCVCLSVCLLRLFTFTWIAMTDLNSWIYNWKKKKEKGKRCECLSLCCANPYCAIRYSVTLSFYICCGSIFHGTIHILFHWHLFPFLFSIRIHHMFFKN